MSFSKTAKQVAEILRSRRQNAILTAETNLETLCEEKDFLEAYRAMRCAEIDVIMAQRKNGDLKKAEETLSAAKQTLKKAFEARGLTEDYILPQYTCKICCDAGEIDGKMCECKMALTSQIIFGDRRLVARGDFSADTETDPENKKVIEEAKLWCKKFPDVKKPNYLLCGHTGVGKTFLTDCIVSELLKKQVDVIYLTAYQMGDAFREKFLNDDDQSFARLIDCSVLVIDDLGKEPIYRNVDLEGFYCLLNERLLNNKSTIVSTNLMIDGLMARYGEGILSRLANKQTTLVRLLTGSDKRTTGGRL